MTSPITNTIGTGTDTLVLKISQDAYQGNAEYTVGVDGQQVDGVLTASALHGTGQEDTVTVKGTGGAGQHTASLTFLNDAYAGTPDTDRNLYVDAVFTEDGAYDGNAALLSAGLHDLHFVKVPPPPLRDWIGGASDNNVYDPVNWSPEGVPQPGDRLTILHGIANVFGGDLSGNRIELMSANPEASVPTGSTAQINLFSAGAQVYDYSPAFLQGRPGVDVGPTINAYGDSTLTGTFIGDKHYGIVTDTINIGQDSVLHATLESGTLSKLAINGAAGAQLDNKATQLGYESTVTINAATVGVGTFSSSGFSTLEFNGAVLPGRR